MKLDLPELLTLVGRLDDAPGTDTPRERFRRFLTEQVTTVAALRSMLDQTHEAIGEQYSRARQDLILLAGRFLGFEVAFGGYESAPGAVRLEGHWRSRRRARIAVEVRSEQTADADVDALARTVNALAASLPGDTGERWVGLCVTTPFYAAVRRLESQLAQRSPHDIRCISIESLLWLADMAIAGRVEHEDVVRLLTSGPDSDFMVSLMRRLTESSGGERSTEMSSAAPEPTRTDTPRLSIVARPEREKEPETRPRTGYWLVTLVEDEMATPEQLLDAVIARRHVLGLSNTGTRDILPREGDFICFHIEHVGIVGHGQLDSAISDASAVIRGAARFSVVFRLKNVRVYEVPHVILKQWIEADLSASETSDGCAFVAPLTREMFERLTTANGGPIAASS